jgi:hypothetical protein
LPGGCDAPWQQISGAPVWKRDWTPNATGTFAVFVAACDVHRQCASTTHFFNVTNPFPKISPLSGETFRDDSRVVKVRPAEGLYLRAVMYRFANESRIYNMTPPKSGETDWTTDPTFPGWKKGPVNITILAQEQPLFVQGHKIEGGLVEDNSASRSYVVSQDFQDLNQKKEPSLPETAPSSQRRTPGLEAPLVALAVVAAAVLVGRSRRHG